MRTSVLVLVCGVVALCSGCGSTSSSHSSLVPLSQSNVQVINVRNFGAKGDGSDDSAALIAAVRHINALGDRPATLYFPEGVYSINPLHGMENFFGLLLTASNVEIYGDHAQLQLLPGESLYNQLLAVPPNTTFYWNYFEVRGSNVRVHDMQFNSEGMTTTGGYSGDYGMFWASALDINGTPEHMQTGNSVTHNRFLNMGGWAVNSSYQNNLTIDSNYASSSEGMGCGGQVYGCTITNNVSENGLDAHFFSNGYMNPGTQNQNVVIGGNTATGNSNGAGIDVTASWDTVVENNTVSGNANWCILVGKTWGPYKEDGPYLGSERVMVKNNTCTENGWYQGWPMNAEIFVGEQYAGTLKPGDAASDVTIANNKLTSQNSQGRGVVVGYGAARVTIDSNELDGCGNTCAAPVIRIEEIGTQGLTVTNNKQDTQFATTYIYLGQVGPYTTSGNEMVVHQ